MNKDKKHQNNQFIDVTEVNLLVFDFEMNKLRIDF